MNQVNAFLIAEMKAEEARRRCKHVKKSGFDKALRRWIALEIKAAKACRTLKGEMTKKQLKRYKRGKLVEIACGLREIRQGKVWVQ